MFVRRVNVSFRSIRLLLKSACRASLLFGHDAAFVNMGSFRPLAAICTKVRFCILLWADCRSKQAVFVQRCLRVAVIPQIK